MNSREQYFALLLSTIGVAGALVGMHLTIVWGPKDTYMVLASLGLVFVVALCIYGHKADSKLERALVERILDEMSLGGIRSYAPVILELACKVDGEPKSRQELMERLDLRTLRAKFGAADLRFICQADVDEVRVRCQALPDRVVRDLFGEKSGA